MYHHIVYWKMARRELDVTDAQLARLEIEDDRGEIYIEFLDGCRVPQVWDRMTGRRRPRRAQAQPSAA